MYRSTITWVDVGERERLTVLTSDVGAPATLADLRVMSNATVTTLHEGLLVATGASLASPNHYSDLSDSWIVSGADHGAYEEEIYIPAPLLAYAAADRAAWYIPATQWTSLQAALPAASVHYTGHPISQIDVARIARDTGGIYQTFTNLTGAVDWSRRTLQWWDIHGRTRLTHLMGIALSIGADYDLLMGAMQALSAAVVSHYWEGLMTVYTDPPTTSMYNSVNDACRIFFQDDFGNITEVILPAPASVIFLADGKTLNTAQANVAAMIASALTELRVPTSGRAVTSCLGGHLAKHSIY